MSQSFQQFGVRAISGEDHTLPAIIARGVASTIEPFYATAMRLRNAAYDHGILKTHHLGRPTISVGNITTGGTGKTPVVQWLADQLIQRGCHPAILLRGYGSSRQHLSDEAELLREELNIPIQANPSRVAGAATVLREHPEVDLFILDDAFQHRTAARDFNLVLISATQPFGFDHVLPRGLLREPLSGLNRADAFLITRCSLAGESAMQEITGRLQKNFPAVPRFYCDHHLSGLRMVATGQIAAMESLAGQTVFVAAGIADPAALARQVKSTGCTIVGSRWFDDHHAFTFADMDALLAAAKGVGATLLITTAKDWVKMRLHRTPSPTIPPIGVLPLEIHFRGDDGLILSQRVIAAVEGTGRSAS